MVAKGKKELKRPFLHVAISLPVCIILMSSLSGGLAYFEADKYEGKINRRDLYSLHAGEILQNANVSVSNMDILEEAYRLKFTTWESSPFEFRGAFYYIGTCVTTIGFGWYYPTSIGGKVLTGLCVFFIPVMATTAFYYASFWGITNAILFDYFIASCKPCFGKRTKKFRLFAQDIAVIFNSLSSFLALSMIMQYSQPSWTLSDAMYFVWLSAFTIGISGNLIAQNHFTFLSILFGSHFFLILFGTTLMLVELMIETTFNGNKKIVRKTARAFEEHIQKNLENLKKALEDMQRGESVLSLDTEHSLFIMEEIKKVIDTSIQTAEKKLSTGSQKHSWLLKEKIKFETNTDVNEELSRECAENLCRFHSFSRSTGLEMQNIPRYGNSMLSNASSPLH